MRPLNDEQRALVENNIKLVYFVVQRKFPRCQTVNGILSQEDLIAYGFEGLVRAAGTFKPGMKCQFSTWAARNISWSVRDGYRETDRLSRYNRRTGVNLLEQVDIDEKAFKIPNEHREWEPETWFLSREPGDVWRYIATLSEREQYIIKRRYVDGQNLKTIASELNISNSRINQILNRIYGKLRILLDQAESGELSLPTMYARRA